MVAGEVGRPRLGALEQVGVVAALAQLHHDVQQPRAVRAAVDRLDVLSRRSAPSPHAYPKCDTMLTIHITLDLCAAAPRSQHPAEGGKTLFTEFAAVYPCTGASGNTWAAALVARMKGGWWEAGQRGGRTFWRRAA